MRSRSSQRAFTLIEGLFSFLIVLLVLGALANTLVNAGKVRNNRDNMDRAADELHLLNSIGSDIASCLQLVAPAVSGTGSLVHLRRINPDLSFNQRIDVTSSPGQPFDSLEQVDVVYRIEAGMLAKTVTVPGAPARTLRLLKASRFEASREGDLVTLTLVFDYSRVEKTRILKVDVR